VVTAELVSTGVELANREVEVAQLRRALTSRVWIEQAKGVLVATRGVSPDAAFQQLRKQARSSSRKLADLAREVVQAAQRERVAALAVDDARVRAAEGRAREADGSGPPTHVTGPPTNATRPPTHASGQPARLSSGRQRQQGTYEAAPNGCGRGVTFE
jgi:hypothetical protein